MIDIAPFLLSMLFLLYGRMLVWNFQVGSRSVKTVSYLAVRRTSIMTEVETINIFE